MSESHGVFTIKQQNNLIIATFSGSFNRESIVNYSEEMKVIVNKLNDFPFIMLIDNSLVEGGTPDAYEELNQFNDWLKYKPLIAKAYVFSNEPMKAIFQQRSPSITAHKIAFFTAFDDALAWLKA